MRIFMMEYIIKPAVAEFNLMVVRADQMGKPGMKPGDGHETW